MGLALEEELLRGAGGEEGEDVGDGDLEEHHVDDLAVSKATDAHALENTIGIPRREAPPDEEEGGEASNGSEGAGYHEDDWEDPALGV